MLVYIAAHMHNILLTKLMNQLRKYHTIMTLIQVASAPLTSTVWFVPDY